MMKKKIIVVAGPTAVGKTALGIQLAQRFNGEIISGDSQQVYQQLDIGTAKASPEEQAAAVHHLIDVRQVTESYSAFDFVREAHAAIDAIINRGKLPIIVGGTGLYLQSLLEGYHLGGNLDQEALLAYRQELEKEEDETIFAKVAEKGLDIPQLNRRRAIRALELAKFGQDLTNQDSDLESLLIGLTDERQVLYDRINARVDVMIANGLLEEAKWLYDHHPDVQAARGIGYKELFPYFAGQEDLETSVERLKQNTRRFAKRQLTWFRNRMSVDFYQISDQHFQEKIATRVEDFLKES
ncbi:tRNA (adenosine(37)-N6)-dimethylallyltransferase MiaA [Streptococcus pluranimalium]|uniref:tRNA (adenosine(37)-N6)-dimethylallyltransferase MiaA n=2 Tax=Streptococcus pluranimalium TaxID=82348 RepID=UPI001C4C5F45|nr:tRNA (adenosine(37)-N6)-dimethylallyltransferase MiaA [Streptococcus pluranimalium]HEM6115471.1 tRNA (adenosine(37)-N6)-dimethylallyltransferase MiaA [Streptococcus suis]